MHACPKMTCSPFSSAAPLTVASVLSTLAGSLLGPSWGWMSQLPWCGGPPGLDGAASQLKHQQLDAVVQHVLRLLWMKKRCGTQAVVKDEGLQG